MKKRILSILLLCCMVLTLLPTTAFAAGKIWVGTEEELLAALADNTIGKITLTADITVSQTLVIDRQVVLVLDHSLKIDREQSSSGTLFHITKSGYLDTNAGSITDNVLNEGKFFPRQISGEVINEGEIIRGSFSGKVKNRGSINYGSFRGEVENAPGGKIANGELYGEVTNHGEIAGWKFYGKVTNDTDGLITSGEFYGEVVNNGRISYGKFYGDVVNNGTITGGSFFGTLTGGEIQDNAYIAVTFDSDGGSTVAAQRILRGQKAQRPAAPTKDGYTFIGWYNKADLQYINLPEWNFDYPVFENMELVAQWMEARPISTDPITYLDKDGNQQVCTAYTVLTSETKESILNYDDKWYDLPAGWYVVEGGVTITPRLDTHGAVNLILTNGSHLTAEWGIDVKVGDTFTVYAQSTDEGTMGRLTACLPADFNLDRMVHYSVWPDSGMAGIGSSARWREGNDGIRESEGTIVINGGNIRAKGQDNASAIGGTRAEEIEFRSTDRGEVYNRRQGGSITINGGVVRTEPFALLEGNPLAVISVGIGTCQMGYGGSVTINGGTVIAEAANDAITTGDGGTITINGGDVTARGGVNNFGENSHRVLSGNGIGPLLNGSITINGGTVKATAEGHGFGIGGSRFEIIGTATVTINGGTIDATANHNNAAIGDRGKGKSGVTITDGVIHAAGKGSAAGIGSMGDIRITGGELTVSAEGSGAAIGGFTDKYSERVNCKSITINGDVIQSISSKDGACIGAAAGGSVGSIAISNAELSSLSAEKILIGWGADSPGGKLTIRNCRVESTDELTTRTDGIRVGSNSEIVIEESEIRLPHLRGIRVGGNGSIAVRDSDLHTYGIFMDETVQSPNDAKTLKKLEITGSTVLTGDIIGARGGYSSVEEVVIHDSSIRLNDEYPYNYCTIGGGTNGSFGSIDIQNSQIHIPSSGGNTAIGNGWQVYYNRESRIRIANSKVSVRCASLGPAIGAAWDSGSGRINIIIENSTVTAKGGNLRTDGNYVPGIGKNALGRAPEIGIQILNSTVDSFRLTEKGGTDYVYDDLHTKELPGIPAENISICGSTVNRKTIDHSFDEYGKCTLCGKYDLGYCYEHGLLTMEGLTDCVSDGSEKKLTLLFHKTGENETKQLAENTDYTASYSNNVAPYTLTPEDEGFDPAKAPKVTLYGTGNYCGKAEHYFTISESAAAAPSITTDTLPDGKVGEAYSQTLTATGTAPITWSVDGGLPADLSLNVNTGEISGTPTAAGTSTFTVKATNSAGSNTKELSITITKDAPAEHAVTITTEGGGTASVSPAKAVADVEITLTATPNGGYHFKEWLVESPTGLVITNNKFIMPDSNVEVKAVFEEDAPPAPTDPAKPSISVTGTYTYNGSEHTATVNGYDPSTMDIAGNTATDAGDYTVRVTSKTGKWVDGSTDAVTAAWSIGKATQEAPNGLTGVAPTEEGGDGKITGVDATMEYRAESETIYIACIGIEIENLSAGNYFVRYAEDHNHFASPDAEVTVGEGTSLADCTITFNAGGGSGSMDSVTVKAGANYILPECGFTAPADQEFKAWEIGGMEYEVGNSYTVNGDTEIKALWENSVITPTTYNVTVNNDGNGTASANPHTAAAGTTITLTAKANRGYHFKEWQVISGGVAIKDDKFLMPNDNVEVKAIFEEDAPPAPTEHTITVITDGNGMASASPAKAVVGTEIRLTATPNKGYHFKEWEVISGGVTIKDNKFIMPNDNVEVKAIFEKDAPAPTEYTITYDLAGGTAEGNPDTYTIETRTFTLTNPTKSGYTFTGWSGTGLTGENNLTVTIEKGSTGDRSYTAHWRYNGSGHSYSYYTIKATAGAGGSISPSGNVSVREGRDQTFTITPDKGYAVANVKIDGKSIGAVKSYTFENVSRTHTIEVIFMKANGNPQTGVFVDVATGSYYEDAVDWAVENGITKGTDDTHFSPDGICTRAQAVTFLWRTAGSPKPEIRTMPFTDVPVGSYYYDAVLWAVENGITKGTSDTTFSPNMTCTRAQIVAFLWRSEKSPAAGTANPFADVKSTAYYADAVLWAVREDITKGTTSTTFSPDADCTRAQIVTFLWRCKK